MSFGDRAVAPFCTITLTITSSLLVVDIAMHSFVINEAHAMTITV
jgi:hypothetical protein